MDLVPLVQPLNARSRYFDWDAIARGWGRRPPADYIAFMSDVGPGVLGDYLSIMAPASNLDTARDLRAEELGDLRAAGDESGHPGAVKAFDMALETQAAEEAWRALQVTGAVIKPRLVCWGISDDSNQYCWDVSVEDMPIVVFDRGYLEWSSYDLSFSEFVAGLIEDSISGYNGDPIASERGWQIPVAYKVHAKDVW